MRDGAAQVLPLARTDRLVVQELPDEVLVYDLERHKAHCLNKTSAMVWERCDGRTTVAEMTRRLGRELSAPVDDDVVWLALAQLRRFHLLEEGSGSAGLLKISRRDLVRKYLPAALTVPLILSVPAPTPAQAASRCAGPCEPCDFSTNPCCDGLSCDGICFPCPR
ncbi:MAG TPA: PqqD family protein [Pyrinomonadaceae bacterium]|nr:PqqD family protein [Pyrinomonadaceae bacterium]